MIPFYRYRATFLAEPTKWRCRVEVEDRQGYVWIGHGDTITAAEQDAVGFRRAARESRPESMLSDFTRAQSEALRSVFA